MRRLFLAALLAAFCTALPAAEPDPEYAVCQAYLASPGAEKPADLLYEKLGIFFIYNVKHESPEALLAFFRDRAGVSLDPGMVQAFVTANRRPRRIDPARFPAPVKLSKQFIQAGVYSLSRVGFNARKDEALLYASFASLQEDGHGALIHLKKTPAGWAVQKAAAVWMYGASVHPFNP